MSPMPDDYRLTGTGDLAVFLGGSADSWIGMFLLLLQKSDPAHKAGLQVGFPRLVRAYDTWQSLPGPPTAGELTAALGSVVSADRGHVRVVRTSPGVRRYSKEGEL